MAETKKYLHTLDVSNNKVTNLLLNPLTTAQRTTIGGTLGTGDKGYVCYDTDLNKQYFWDGTTWIVSGGVQNLQQVVNVGNGISNYGGVGYASIQSTNFTSGRTLYLNDNSYPTIRLVDNANSSNYLQIDIDTLNIDGTSYNWSSIVNQGTVTSVTATSPLFSSGGTTPNLTIQQASGSQAGYLSSTDWTTFNSKFNLPSLTAGSVLFSNGTTIAQDNANFFWDDTNNRLGIGTITPQYRLDVNGSINTNTTYYGKYADNATVTGIDLFNERSSWFKVTGGPTSRLSMSPNNGGFVDSFYIDSEYDATIRGGGAYWKLKLHGTSGVDFKSFYGSSLGTDDFSFYKTSTKILRVADTTNWIFNPDTNNSYIPQALINVKSNSKGILLPQVTTTERNTIIPTFAAYPSTPGSGYRYGSNYGGVPLIGGSGTGAIANLFMYGDAVGFVTITSSGNNGYQVGDTLTFSNTYTENLGSGAVITITQVSNGLLLYNTTTNKHNYWNGSAWVDIGGTGGGGTVTSVAAGTGMSFTAITTSGSVAIDTAKVPYYVTTPANGLLRYTSGTWSTDATAYLTSAVTSLNGLTGATQTFANDTNVQIVSSGTTHTLTWSGTLADNRIAGAPTWNRKQDPLNGTGFVKSTTSGIISYDNSTYTPTSRTLTINGVAHDLSADQSWTISSSLPVATSSVLGGVKIGSGVNVTGDGTISVSTAYQPGSRNLDSLSGLSFASSSFVKMTGIDTFTLDTNTYLTSAVTSIATTGLISGGTITNTGTITTSMSTGKLVGRYSSGTGIMQEITVGDGLGLSRSGQLINTATPTPLGYYLAISDSTTQTNPTANTPRAVKFDTTDLANGFSLQTETAVFTGTINNGGAGAGTILTVTGITSGTLKVGMVLTGGSITAGTFISAFTSGTGGVGTYVVSVSQLKTSATYTGTMTSQIVVANTGIYNIQFSSQLDKSDAGVDIANFWLRRNGTDVPYSAGNLSLQGNSPAYMMAAWNYVIELLQNDVIELYWASADANMSIYSEAVQTSPYPHPAIQSTILTITQQSGIMAGTGITAINSLTGSVQTLTTGTSGTDFAITSSGTSHTFNLPTASASNRGALSTSDFTNFNTAYTNRITSLTTTGSSGSATLSSNTLNVPTYTLSGLGGQPLATNLTSLAGLSYASASFVKMTATGTFSLDTNTYLTSVGTGTTNQITYWSGTNTIAALSTATYPSLTELSYVKGVTSAIQTQIDGKQATLTNPVTGTGTNNEIAYFNTTGSTIGSLSTGTYPSLTELSYVKGVTSAVQTQLGAKQDLSLSAYTLRANNTAATANATDQAFVDTSGAYTGTITFTGTAPTGTTNYSYKYTQVGKMCTISINLSYTTAASCTSVTLTLPTICAAPVSPGGMGANNEFIYPGYGMTWSTKSIPAGTGLNSARTCWMRKNASGVNEMVIFNYSAASTIFLSGTVIYWTS